MDTMNEMNRAPRIRRSISVLYRYLFAFVADYSTTTQYTSDALFRIAGDSGGLVQVREHTSKRGLECERLTRAVLSLESRVDVTLVFLLENVTCENL
jgi:hypothetical protein